MSDTEARAWGRANMPPGDWYECSSKDKVRKGDLMLSMYGIGQPGEWSTSGDEHHGRRVEDYYMVIREREPVESNVPELRRIRA